jgi:CIC family chloride channel protein
VKTDNVTTPPAHVSAEAATTLYLPVLEAIIIGSVAGLSAVLLLSGIRLLGTWRIQLSPHYPDYVVLPAIGLLGGLIAGIFVQIAPEVSGSGIPQVRALLDRIQQRLDFRSAVAKLFSGVIALGCGLFMGREGPTVQVGAALAASLTRLLPTTARHRRELIAAGAGAGLAAAFNAPLAGVTFVMEELLKTASASAISLSLIACFSGAVVENLFGQQRQHSLIKANLAAVPLQLLDLLFYVILGLLCAFFGAVFNSLILAFLRLYKRSRLPVVARTALAGVATGAIVSVLPVAFHNYAEMRLLINNATVAPDLVPLAFVCFFLLVLIAYGSGAPGGLFAPTLVLGAALGYMVGFIHWKITGVNLVDIFTQVGMGALFSAVARVPLTATVIVFEMSGNFGLIPPLMLAGVLASAVAEALSAGSLYDALMIWAGINLQGPRGAARDSMVMVRTMMQPPGKTLAPELTISQAADSLEELASNSCPVVQGGLLVGVIDKAQIELARQRNPGQTAITTGDCMLRNPVSVSPYDKLDDILLLFSRYGFQWLPVTEDQRLIGVITRQAALDHAFGSSAAKSEN